MSVIYLRRTHVLSLKNDYVLLTSSVSVRNFLDVPVFVLYELPLLRNEKVKTRLAFSKLTANVKLTKFR
ncbi:hypothetical protein Q8A67_006875 [Cirrhinus molitorella]|uniref:Uncharacterized protein n=1 Tax=Cirrhinus molitorella TaxID=172907 RepID=A0AA88Q5B7_9TELE|nr:hypothetical protein Q8A67_006875 [Cirrhinus molitorella]